MEKINPVELQKHLKDIDYPANKNSIIEKAKQNKADKDTMDALEKIPDMNYNKPTDVSREAMKVLERK